MVVVVSYKSNNHHHQLPNQHGPLNSSEGDRWLPRVLEAHQRLWQTGGAARWNPVPPLRLGVLSMQDDGLVQRLTGK